MLTSLLMGTGILPRNPKILPAENAQGEKIPSLDESVRHFIGENLFKDRKEKGNECSENRG